MIFLVYVNAYTSVYITSRECLVMKAAVMTEPYKIEIQEVAKPVPRPNEVIIRVVNVMLVSVAAIYTFLTGLDRTQITHRFTDMN